MKRQVDEQDDAIIAMLTEDGRMAVRELAQRVGLNEATVRARIRRLEDAGLMRVVAKLDTVALGFPITALVGLKIRGRSIDAVSRDLTEVPEILSILSVIGRNDLEIQVIAPDLAALDRLLNERILAIDGIVESEKAVATRVHKYVQPWGRFDEKA